MSFLDACAGARHLYLLLYTRIAHSLHLGALSVGDKMLPTPKCPYSHFLTSPDLRKVPMSSPASCACTRHLSWQVSDRFVLLACWSGTPNPEVLDQPQNARTATSWPRPDLRKIPMSSTASCACTRHLSWHVSVRFVLLACWSGTPIAEMPLEPLRESTESPGKFHWLIHSHVRASAAVHAEGDHL